MAVGLHPTCCDAITVAENVRRGESEKSTASRAWGQPRCLLMADIAKPTRRSWTEGKDRKLKGSAYAIALLRHGQFRAPSVSIANYGKEDWVQGHEGWLTYSLEEPVVSGRRYISSEVWSRKADYHKVPAKLEGSR